MGIVWASPMAARMRPAAGRHTTLQEGWSVDMVRLMRRGCAYAGVLALLVSACSQAPAAAPAATSAPAAGGAATSAPAAGATTAPAAGAAASTGGAAVSCAEHASQGSGGDAIKIGADGSLTGATANFGIGMKRGIEICLKEFNDA